MSGKRLREINQLEGRRVSVALCNGDRIDDVPLISAGRDRTRTLWLFMNGADRFISVKDVVEVWEAQGTGRSLAA